MILVRIDKGHRIKDIDTALVLVGLYIPHIAHMVVPSNNYLIIACMLCKLQQVQAQRVNRMSGQ